MPHVSPLRYPGGKSLLANFVADVLGGLPDVKHYMEPFAGGAAVALRLLYEGRVSSVAIGDSDPAVAAFWRCAVADTDELIERVNECQVDLSTWHAQYRTLTSSEPANDLDLGFATFFLNRTNRSGILRARPIGGLHQDGPWRLDCRFNKSDLVKRLRKIAQHASQIEVFEGEAIDLLTGTDEDRRQRTFVYVDPPYLTRSSGLYLDEMSFGGHRDIAQLLRSEFPYWMASYDIDDRVKSELYPGSHILTFALRHCASSPHVGTEQIAFSDACALGGKIRYPNAAASVWTPASAARRSQSSSS
ncbi:DNA adenine methylase [Candidatus Poriferisodalis sp.]|uniref:DNA adenine methylase n=1 Tax=Candidatus Poriferisodalis sp. TaxID=3101277 RepID=UPI003B5CEAC9